jgi:hypothetical protein
VNFCHHFLSSVILELRKITQILGFSRAYCRIFQGIYWIFQMLFESAGPREVLDQFWISGKTSIKGLMPGTGFINVVRSSYLM